MGGDSSSSMAWTTPLDPIRVTFHNTHFPKIIHRFQELFLCKLWSLILLPFSCDGSNNPWMCGTPKSFAMFFNVTDFHISSTCSRLSCLDVNWHRTTVLFRAVGLLGEAVSTFLGRIVLGLVSFGEPHSSFVFPLLTTELSGVLPGVRGLRKGDLFVNLEVYRVLELIQSFEYFCISQVYYLYSPLFSLKCSTLVSLPRTSSNTPALRNLHNSCRIWSLVIVGPKCGLTLSWECNQLVASLAVKQFS